MNTSIYQGIKQILLTISGLSKDAVHIYVGMTVFSGWIILFRNSMRSLKSVLPVAAVALLLELLDMWDNYHSVGQLRLAASVHDILNTIFWPLVIVLLLKFILGKPAAVPDKYKKTAERVGHEEDSGNV